MITRVYFIRHAEPEYSWKEDRTRPLTSCGHRDSRRLVKVFAKISIDVFYSSPYLRTMDTIRPLAISKGMEKEIVTKEGFRERESGEAGNVRRLFHKRWADFSFAEPGGESLGQCQTRNIQALEEVLRDYQGKTVVIGTHGTALSTILNYYQKDYGVEDFYHMMHFLPYVVKAEFEGKQFIGQTPIYKSDKTLKRRIVRSISKWRKK